MSDNNDFADIVGFFEWLKTKYPDFKENYGGSFNALTDREVEVLLRLYLIKRSNVSVISKEMNISGGSVSNIMRCLMKKGYVYKNYPNMNEDARKRYFYISESGIAVLKQVIQSYIDLLNVLYDEMDSTHRQEFENISKTASDMFSAVGEYSISDSITQTIK